MRIFITFFLLLLFNVGYSQNYPFCTSFIIDYEAGNDLTFLNNLEYKILDNINNIDKRKEIASNVNFLSREFRMEFTPSEVKGGFSRDVPKEFINKYESFLVWNKYADTCLIIGFSRLYERNLTRTDCIDTIFGKDRKDFYRTYNKRNNLPEDNYIIKRPCKNTTVFLGKDTIVNLAIPLGDYRFFLSKDSVKRLNDLVKKVIMKQFEISDYDSIRVSESIIAIDSIILPHAPLDYFTKFLLSLPYSIKMYSNPMLSKQMTNIELQNIQICWDSTITVEDPENSGTFISTPIKYRSDAISICIINKWNFIDMRVNNSRELYFLKSQHLSLTKQIYAIGIEYSNGKKVYFSYEEVKKTRKKYNVNFEPYNQIFIGAGSKKLNLLQY